MDRPSGRSLARHGPLGPIGGFLDRFRRSGGVPASVGGDVASELAPVFAALDRLEREAEEFRVRSEAALARRAYDAEEEADEILAEARTRADRERDDALSAGLNAAEVEAAGIVSQGEADAKRIREAGEGRLPGFVAEVLARVLEAGS